MCGAGELLEPRRRRFSVPPIDGLGDVVGVQGAAVFDFPAGC